MIDLEISTALALAIGWKPHQLMQDDDLLMVCAEVATLKTPARWRWFDYRDPGVIWPIAERYDAFPIGIGSEWQCIRYHKPGDWVRHTADTAAKAVAFAVIGRTA